MSLLRRSFPPTWGDVGTHTWREWGRQGSWLCHELSAVCRLTLAYGLLFLQNHSGSIEEGIWEKHRSGFRKCVWSPAPEWEGELESKPSPSFPAQVQPPGPRDVPSCPGNVLPGHTASTSLHLPFLLGLASLAPLAEPALRGGTASRWGPGESQKDQYQRARPSFHPVFGGAQLPAAAAAVNGECGLDTRVKNPQCETISDCTKGSCGPAFQLHQRKFARGKRAEAWANAKLESCCTQESFPDKKQSRMPNEEYIP